MASYGTNESEFEKKVKEVEAQLGRELTEEEKKSLRKTTE